MDQDSLLMLLKVSMKYSHDRSFKMKIQDDWWEIYLLTEEEAIELDEDFPNGFRALTLTNEDKRCIFFTEGNSDKNTITHELFHLYVSYFHLSSTELDNDSFEEICAEFLEQNLDKFIRIRNKIYNKLRRL